MPMTDLAVLTISQHISTSGTESRLFDLRLPGRVGAVVEMAHLETTWHKNLDVGLSATVRQLYEFAAFTHELGSAGGDPLLGPGWLIWQTFPSPIRDLLRQLPDGTFLVFVTDDLTIPWELAFDGEAYVAMRLCTARVPLNHVLPVPMAARPLEQWRALLLGNPTDDLPFAAQEIDELDKLMLPQADPVYSRRITKRIVGERLRSSRYHLIHYSGHAEITATGEAALRLAGHEPLTAREIAASLHGRPWVVLNACNSAQSGDDAQQVTTATANLALTFLLSGAQVVIGTQWPVPDSRANNFSLMLYRNLLAGVSAAEAMRRARYQYWKEQRNDPLWAAYLLFGAPDAVLVAPESWQQESGIAVALALHHLWASSTKADNAELVAQTGKLLDLLETDAQARGAIRIERGGEHWIGYFERRTRGALDFSLTVSRLVRAWAKDSQMMVNPQLRVGIGIALDGIARHLGSGRLWGLAAARAWRLAQRATQGEIIADNGVLAGMGSRYATQPWSNEVGEWRAADAALLDLPVMEVVEQQVNLNTITTTPLVGERHHHCLAELDRLWAAVRREGRGQVLALSGPGGIGKSRLLVEWLERNPLTSSQSLYLLCPSLPTHFGVVAVLLRRLLNAGEDINTPAPRAAIAAQLLNMGEASDSQSFNLVMMLLGMGEMQLPTRADELQRLYRRFARTLMDLLFSTFGEAQEKSDAVSHPLVLMVDDCHLIDSQSASVLRYLTEIMVAKPCFVVLAHHPEWHFEAPNSSVQTYPLPMLTAQEACDLVRHQLSPTTDPQLIAAIAHWVPANPLALDQVVMVLRQRQVLVEHHGAWVLTRSLDEAELPNNIKDLIRDRLRLLTPPLRRVLHEMAVLGAVERDLLFAMLGHGRDEPTVEDALYELELLEFVRENRTRHEIRFIYDVVAREIYHMISPARRRDLHWRAMEVWALRAESDPLRIQAQASHLLASLGDPLKDVGWQKNLHDVTDGRLRTAVQRLQAAADLAQRRSAGLAATTAYEQALAYAEALVQRSGEMADHCVAADLARALGRASMVWGSRLDRALECMEEAWKWLEGLPPTEECQKIAAMIHIHTAAIHYYQGSFASAEQAALRGLAVAEAANAPAAIAEAANLLGVVHDMRADSERALRYYARSAALYAQVGDDYQRTRVRDNQATTFFRQGEWAKAAELEAAGFAYWQRIDDQAKQAMLAMNMTEREAFQGLWSEAEQHANLAATIFAEIEDYRYLALSYTNWGNLRILQVRLDEAEQLFRDALALLQNHAIRDVPAETLCGLSEVARLRHHPAQARHFVNQALAVLAEEGDLYREEAIARRLLGLAHLAQGEMAMAATQLQVSLDLAQQYGLRFEMGRAQMALAELRLAQQQSAAALALLDQAETIMQGLAAQPFLQQISTLRHRR